MGQRKLQLAVLNDVAAVGGVAGGEQNVAALQMLRLRADGNDLQSRKPELGESRHPLQEKNIVLDGHWLCSSILTRRPRPDWP
jgi:hypothetical protein